MPPGNTHPPNNHLQPFVPVRPGERTKLYSNQELCAITSADPRNELDELSEPLRFKKDLAKPEAYLETGARHRRGGSLPLTFLAGAAMGALLAALTAPKTGAGLCRGLKVGRKQAANETGADRAAIHSGIAKQGQKSFSY